MPDALQPKADGALQRQAALRRAARRSMLVVALLVLVGVAWLTIAGGVRQLPRSLTPGQKVETVVQLACGFLSLASVLTAFRWRRWGPAARAAWALSLAAAAGLSSLVWGPPSLPVGLVFAAGTLLLALGIIRLLRAGLAARAGDTKRVT